VIPHPVKVEGGGTSVPEKEEVSSKVLNNGIALVEAKENPSPLDYERKPSSSSKEAPSSDKVSLSNSSHSHQIVR
jgi:hypothetical protein